MAKKKIHGKDILHNILTSFYELDLFDNDERIEILKMDSDLALSFQSQLSTKISKLRRDTIIKREKERQDKQSLYEQAKKLYDAIPNVNEVLKQIFTDTELSQFKLAFRNLNPEQGGSLDDIQKEMLLLKFIKKINTNGENSGAASGDKDTD